MERKKEWEVGGFQFNSEKDAGLAKEEQDKIAYLEKRMRYDQPEGVLNGRPRQKYPLISDIQLSTHGGDEAAHSEKARTAESV